MLLHCSTLSLKDISQSTRWNLHPWAIDSPQKSLHASFTQLGIVSPPLVMETDNNTFIIIAGYRRIEFARSYLAEDFIACRVITKDIEPQLLFDIILEDLADATKLSLAEKAMFLKIASDFFPKETLASLFFSRLGIKRKNSFLNDIFRLLKQDDHIITQAHEGLIEEQMLSELLRLKEEDREALIQIFSHLHLGTGKQKKMLNLLRDAAYKEGISIQALLQSEELFEIIEDKTRNVPQKVQHLDRYLQQKISPQSIAAETEFIAQTKKLKLQKNQSISHSPAFEKDTVTLSTEFDSLEQCRVFLEKNNR